MADFERRVKIRGYGVDAADDRPVVEITMTEIDYDMWTSQAEHLLCHEFARRFPWAVMDPEIVVIRP